MVDRFHMTLLGIAILALFLPGIGFVLSVVVVVLAWIEQSTNPQSGAVVKTAFWITFTVVMVHLFAVTVLATAILLADYSPTP